MKNLLDYKSRFRILKGGKIGLVVSVMFSSTVLTLAAPTGGTVTSGNATISTNGSTTNINQSTLKASINWQTFNIASFETVNFNQPNSSSITLNRVIGNEKSIINGAIKANGQVWILNSSGVLFGKNASVNTSGILATTAKLSDEDFNAGNYKFKNATSNAVINQGTIDVSNASYVVLASNEVINEGSIKAVKGKVHLVGSDSYSINLNGNSLVNLTVNKGVLDSMVKNQGDITSNGGEVYLTTNAVDELLKGVVNNTGIIEAQTLDDITGHIELFANGGISKVAGKLDASARTSGDGGFIETSGRELDFSEDTKINLASKNGKGGEWLIDPPGNDITIGSTLATSISNTLATADVTIKTAGNNNPDTSSGETSGLVNGDIKINSDITWSSEYDLTLSAYRNIYFNSDITASHPTAKVALHFGQGASSINNASFYSFGLTDTGFSGSINLHAGDNFSTKQGFNGIPLSYKVITSLGVAGSVTGTDLQGINGVRNANYVLGANIDASSTSSWNMNTGWTPIGSEFQPYVGNFDGLGHTVDSLFINRDGQDQGLFGDVGYSSIKNIGVTNVNISSNNYIGGLSGYTYYTRVSNVYSTGTLTQNPLHFMQYAIGGLIGLDEYGTIKNSYSKVNVSGEFGVGGLIGILDSSTVNNTYSTGTVTGITPFTGAVGGLIGFINRATLTNSYSTGLIVDTTNGSSHGAFGGLVGFDEGGATITNSFWDTQTSQKATSFGGLGKTTPQMKTLSTFTGATWDIIGTDGKYPIFNPDGSSVWIMESPITYVTYTLTDKIFTYDGSEKLLSSQWSSNDIFGSTYSSWIAGTDYNFIYNSATTTGFTDAGLYTPLSVDVIKTGFDENTSGNTTGSITINKKDLTATFTGIDKVYDGTTRADVLASSSDIVTNDAVNIYYGSSIFADKDVGIEKTVNISEIYLSGVDRNNYNLTNKDASATTKADITKRDLTVEYSGINKEYDGTTNASVVEVDKNKETLMRLSRSKLPSDGLIVGDTVNISETANFVDKDVGTQKTVNVTNIVLSGTDAKNYNLTNKNASATTKADITKKDLELIYTGIDKVYNGTTTASVTESRNDIVTGDVVNISETASFVDKDVGTQKTVNVTNIALSGTDAKNYNLTNVDNEATTKADITKKDLTATFTGIDKVYDGTTRADVLASSSDIVTNDAVNFSSMRSFFYPGVTIIGPGSVDGGFTSDSVNINYASSFFNNKDAGIDKTVNITGISLSGVDAKNYNLTNKNASATTEADITKRDLTIGYSGINKEYDGTTSATVLDFIEKSNSASLIQAFNSAVKEYDLVKIREISERIRNIGSNGLIVGDTVNISETASFVDKDVGTQKTVNVTNIVLSGTDAKNYNLTNKNASATTKANITKKDLTVTANSDTVLYNGIEQEVRGVTTSGLVPGDTIADIDTLNGDVAKGINVGTYNTSLSGSDNNYNLTFVDGTLTIERATPEGVITPIVNEVDVIIPIIKKQAPVNTVGLLVVFENGTGAIVSTDQTGARLEPITMEEVKAMTGQLSVPGTNVDIRVPLSQENSLIQLVNGGVSLPSGISQIFYILRNNANGDAK